MDFVSSDCPILQEGLTFERDRATPREPFQFGSEPRDDAGGRGARPFHPHAPLRRACCGNGDIAERVDRLQQSAPATRERGDRRHAPPGGARGARASGRNLQRISRCRAFCGRGLRPGFRGFPAVQIPPIERRRDRGGRPGGIAVLAGVPGPDCSECASGSHQLDAGRPARARSPSGRRRLDGGPRSHAHTRAGVTPASERHAFGLRIRCVGLGSRLGAPLARGSGRIGKTHAGRVSRRPSDAGSAAAVARVDRRCNRLHPRLLRRWRGARVHAPPIAGADGVGIGGSRLQSVRHVSGHRHRRRIRGYLRRPDEARWRRSGTAVERHCAGRRSRPA